MVIGGLVFVALAIAVLTVLYVRHTKPSRAVTPVIDDDGAGTDEVVRTTADEAGVVAASSAVTVIGAKKVVGHDHDNTVSTIAAAEPSHDAGQSGADMAPDDVVARDDIPAEVDLPTRVDLDVPAAVVTREDLEVLARPSSPLTKADLFAGVPSNTGELPVPRAFDASELFVDDGAAPPSSSA
jgi:hypothetical protein